MADWSFFFKRKYSHSLIKSINQSQAFTITFNLRTVRSQQPSQQLPLQYSTEYHIILLMTMAADASPPVNSTWSTISASLSASPSPKSPESTLEKQNPRSPLLHRRPAPPFPLHLGSQTLGKNLVEPSNAQTDEGSHGDSKT